MKVKSLPLHTEEWTFQDHLLSKTMILTYGSSGKPEQ